MRKVTGNMYNFVNYTWNPIKGKCIHNCKYCYVKQWGVPPDVRLDELVLKEHLGCGNYIFVVSGSDMFASDIPNEWIMKILSQCSRYNNKYLFQTKNPTRILLQYEDHLPKDSVVGTTIETNGEDLIKLVSSAPGVCERSESLSCIRFPTMVTIEPIMEFDLIDLVGLIRYTKPDFVNIGADSKGHALPEPSWNKIIMLKDELSKFTKVTMKDNIYRLQE